MILAFDTSCDDTAVSIFENDKHYSNVIFSQNSVHKKYGGIVPELAARSHVEYIYEATQKALNDCRIKIQDIEYIAVTTGPGLLPSLLVGVSFAKSLSYAYNKPIIPVNHIEGHIFAPFLDKKIEFPFLCLVVSGGHTHIFRVNEVCNYELLGKTLDDAAGEAFDKVARMLNLGYPGGPIIDKLSKYGNDRRFNIPQGLSNVSSLNFSFSGPKTFVNNLVRNLANLSKTDEYDVAASFQRSVIDTLCNKLLRASKMTGIKKIVLSGGVSANSQLRSKLLNIAKKNMLEVLLPSLELTTDNALMIAKAASLHLDKATLEYDGIDANPRIRIY